MNIKDNENRKNVIILFSTEIVLVVATVLMWFATMWFAEQTNAASNMVAFVYGIGTLAVGAVTLIGFASVIFFIGVAIAYLNDGLFEK